MIKMINLDGLNCPCIFCDICDERINGGGVMVWKANAPGDLRMVHIGSCDNLNNLLNGKFEMSRELEKAMTELLHNVSPQKKQVQKRAGRTTF